MIWARAFERATKARANALTMTADPTGLFVANQKQIVELAAKKRLPAIYTSSTYVNAGGIKGTGYFFQSLQFDIEQRVLDIGHPRRDDQESLQQAFSIM